MRDEHERHVRDHPNYESERGREGDRGGERGREQR
jgi:hypothetical protein